ncbi:phage portal protein, partial [Bacteroides thetaiotaomicron]|nr:phage portal protein [Bacteroides thetaiotaomicron]
RKVLSETKAAIVFYPVNKVVDGKKIPELKAKILSLPKDDNVTYEFYPHFDDDDDMDAFIHKFTTKIDCSTYECVKIYTS